MEELCIEGLANHDDREPCVGAREGAGEASVAARAGQAIEPRNHRVRGPTLSTKPEGNTASGVIASRWRAPRGQRPCACTEPPCARTGRSRARPSGRSPGGPLREGRGRTPEMNERGKSDNLVVPAKPPNNAGGPVAEAVEEGGWPRGTRTVRHAPDAVPGKACQAGWTVCARWHEGTRTHGSPRCCITSTWTACGRPTWRSTRRLHRVSIR